MPLPDEVRVKVSSEAAGSIAITGVSLQTLPVRGLVEQMLGVTGKDRARIQEILRRGSLVAGESRLRWEGFEAEAAGLDRVLDTFPDPDPELAFAPSRCFHIQLLAGRERLDLPRSVAARRRLFRRRSFWDAAMEMAVSAAPEYVEYSYRLRCDHYRIALDLARMQALEAAAGLLKYPQIAARVRNTPFDTLELFVRRVRPLH